MWYVKITKRNLNDIKKYRDIVGRDPLVYGYESNYISNSGLLRSISSIDKKLIISNKKFIENLNNITFKKIENINPFRNIIVKAENKEGNTFMVNDVVLGINALLKESNIMKITSFKLSEDSLSVLAITDKNENGVDINDLQQYIVPKYVECVRSVVRESWAVGKIYKIVSHTDFPEFLNIVRDSGIMSRVISWTEDFIDSGHNCFKPSTKEAYNEQNKPKFVLPERWCVKNTSEIVGNYFNERLGYIARNLYNSSTHRDSYLHSHNSEGTSINNFNNDYLYFSFKRIQEGFTEITFEQFKEYVLKE